MRPASWTTRMLVTIRPSGRKKPLSIRSGVPEGENPRRVTTAEPATVDTPTRVLRTALRGCERERYGEDEEAKRHAGTPVEWWRDEQGPLPGGGRRTRTSIPTSTSILCGRRVRVRDATYKGKPAEGTIERVVTRQRQGQLAVLTEYPDDRAWSVGNRDPTEES